VAKILSDSGKSLADTYDVEGSIAGIERLESEDVTLVHEMGGTIFSERFSTFIRRAVSGDISQGISFNTILTDLPAGVFKILGVFVTVDETTRMTSCVVSVRSAVSGREIPIWQWDVAHDDETAVRFSLDGAAAGTVIMLRPIVPLAGGFPVIVASAGQPQRNEEVAFRGIASAFGAGTVEASLELLVGFSQVGGISSRGLPIPGW